MKLKNIFFLIILLTNLVSAETTSTLLPNPCIYGWIENESTGFTCVDIKSVNNENYGIELCIASANTCIYFNSNESIPLNISDDYIIKIVPINISSTSDLRKYIINRTFMLNIITVVFFIFIVLMLLKVII